MREKKRGVSGSGSRILRFFFSTGSFFQNFTAEWIVSRFFFRYGLKKNLKGDIVFYTSSAFPVEKEINHSSGLQRFRMKDTFYYQTSEETVFSRFSAYGEKNTGC